MAENETVTFTLRARDTASSIVAGFRGKLKMMKRDAQEVSAAFKRMHTGFSDAIGGMVGAAKRLTVGLVATLTAVTAAVAGVIGVAQRYGEEVDRVNKITGVQTSAIQGLAYAAQQEFGSLESLTTGFRFLARAMFAAAEAEDKQAGKIDRTRKLLSDTDPELQGVAKAFDDLGIRVRTAQGSLRPLDDVMLDIADRFAKMQNSAQRSALAMKFFGRSGTELVPFLSMGRRGIKALAIEAQALGLILSTEDVRALEEFGDQIGRLQSGLKGLAIQIGTALMPIARGLVVEFVDNWLIPMVSWVRQNRSAIQDFARWIVYLGRTLVQNVFRVIQQNGPAFIETFQAVRQRIEMIVANAGELVRQVLQWAEANKENLTKLVLIGATLEMLKGPLSTVGAGFLAIAATIRLIGLRTLIWVGAILYGGRALRAVSEVAQSLLMRQPISWSEAWKRAVESQKRDMAELYKSLTAPLRSNFPELFGPGPSGPAGQQVRSEFRRQGGRVVGTFQGGFITGQQLYESHRRFQRQLGTT